MNHFNRRQALQLAAGIAALAAAGCSGTAVQRAEQEASAAPSSTPSALGSATIGLTYIPNIQFAPFYWAAQNRGFAARGVDATLRHHGANEGLFTALAAGKEHFAIAGGDEVLQARGEGLDLVTVAGYYQRYPVAVIVLEDSDITGLADLKGRRIGLPGEFGETWFGLQLALSTAGLDRSQVQVTSIGYTQQAALTTRKVDAIMGFVNNDVVQFTQAGVAVREIPIAGEIPLVSSSVVTTRALLEKSPALVEAVARTVVDGVQAVVRNPAAAVEASTSHIPGLTTAQARKNAMATLEATIPLWRGGESEPTLRLSTEQFIAMEAFMSQSGLLPKPVDPLKAVAVDVLG
ncbi:ABC transporter substrate-binding protein [Luteococcus sp. Sow4_B9]|uniref:ABC transporter substrate-binding protein n=1 Tax=Luteococcus sp. Sow4_B9 TaxID=3438792 RepID=UPI003F978104